MVDEGPKHCTEDEDSPKADGQDFGDAIVNSKWFVNTKVILCFTKQEKLAAKMEASPMKKYFLISIPAILQILI